MQQPFNIKDVYRYYYQKSLTFLYPVLGHKRDQQFKPANTFISWGRRIHPNDKKLLVTYKSVEHPQFPIYEQEALFKNGMYTGERHGLRNGHNVYIFGFDHHTTDWEYFLAGKYSRLSPTLKESIRQYRGPISQDYGMLDSYLFPERYHKVYAELLNVDLKLLHEVVELTDKYDPVKENLTVSIGNLNQSKNFFYL